MVASREMNSLPRRRPRSWSRAALAGCLFLGSTGSAFATSLAPNVSEIVADRHAPSSLSAEYGPAISIGAGSGDGLFLVPTGAGIEIRDTALGAADVIGSFRAPGSIDRAAVSGTVAYLFAGDRGIVAVDLSAPSSPAAIGSLTGLGPVTMGAALPVGHGLAVSDGDSTLHILAADGAGGMTPLRSVTFTDGRRIGAILARSDSFLVASTRPGPIPRLIVTLYRLQQGSSVPESLREFAVNGHEALDVAWNGPLAFIADGNLGVLVLNVGTGSPVRSVPVQASQYTVSIDASDTAVVAVAQGKVLARYRRAGAALDSLAVLGVDPLDQEALHVRLRGDLAIASTYDQVSPVEPDEVGRCTLEFARLSGVPGPLPVGGTGKTRRVAWQAGLAYVADYTGGLRIYRASGPDTSLVGVLPVSATDRIVDLALDGSRSLAYLAAGFGGLWVVDVSDPSSPAFAGSLAVSGFASAVAIAGPNLVAVARRGTPGVTFVDVTIASGPFALGSVDAPLVQDPRALAARGTVLFVADDQLGLLSLQFSDPLAPTALGAASGIGARDLDLTGNTLLVGTRTRGLQVVDVTTPASPALRFELPVPAIQGVARSGGTAALFLGDAGILAVDVAVPSVPFVRGPIAVPGFARDGAWVGDTLLVAAGLALERFTASAVATVPSLTLQNDVQGALPIVRISWSPVSLGGVVGFNVYRDLGPATGGAPDPDGRRVNQALLPPDATGVVDDSVSVGQVHRYRLEAFFADGGSRKIGEGSILVASGARVGRPYPNPYRPSAGGTTLPYLAPAGSTGRSLTLRVHEVSGRLIRTIPATVPAAGGFGSISWDGRDDAGRRVPDGIYFLHLEGAGLDDARTITLLR